VKATAIHPKVAASGAAGFVTVIVLGVAERAHLDLTAVEAASITGLLMLGAAYMKRS
jgi:hypothetical protein